MRTFVVAVLVVIGIGAVARGAATEPGDRWVRPDGSGAALPLWGVRGGIAVGLAPLPGPRGLIRVYAPYLGQPAGRMINFIAVEPVVKGVRDLSELQKSGIDGKQGLRMWAADAVDLDGVPGVTTTPARGVVGKDGAAETLTVYFCVERYRNGAHCVIRVRFRSDRPDEVELSTLAAGDSEPMEACVLTATMGNFARLRHLRFGDGTIEAADVFRGATVNSWGFFDWHSWDLGGAANSDGKVSVAATGDPDRGDEVAVPEGWRYVGEPAVQSWRADLQPGIKLRVNGREVFWATKATVPGGAAVENFELYAPFRQGERFWFGVERAHD